MKKIIDKFFELNRTQLMCLFCVAGLLTVVFLTLDFVHKKTKEECEEKGGELVIDGQSLVLVPNGSGGVTQVWIDEYSCQFEEK